MSNADLIARLEALTGPVDGGEIDRLIKLSPWYHDTPSSDPLWGLFVRALQGSLDAAIALTERLLPGYVWSISDGDEHGPNAFVHHRDNKMPVGDMAATPAIALLIATLKALATKEEGT